MKKDRIKLKIKALLAKTTKSGASKEEAISAMKKAQELMKSYFITENDLSDPFLGEKCVLRQTSLYKTGYKVNFFYAELCFLFDCEHYYNNESISFFGFESDTELCIYFYEFIMRALFVEKKKYMNSSDYKIMKFVYNGRSLCASFIKGFLLQVSRKMHEMYRDRESEFNDNQSYGLVIVKKKDKVETAFKGLGLDLREVKNSDIKAQRDAFESGALKGKELELTQGVGAKKSEISMLN